MDEKDRVSSSVFRGAGATFGLKVASGIVLFLSSLFLARFLGALAYGAYAYAFAWVGILGMPATLGLNHLLVRTMAVYHAQSAWGLMRGLLRQSNLAVLAVSVLLMMVLGLVNCLLFIVTKDTVMTQAIWVAMPILPLFALTQLRQAALRGLHHVILGQLPEAVIRPLLFLTFLLTAYLFFPPSLLSVPTVILLHGGAIAVAFALGNFWLNRTMPKEVKTAPVQTETRLWLASAVSFLFIEGIYTVYATTDIVMLGAIRGAEAAGIYSVVNRGAGLITFSFVAVNTVLAPVIARLYTANDMVSLQKTVTRSARLALCVSLPLGIVLMALGHWFLLMFGGAFTRGKAALDILCLGQLVNVGMGSVGLLLVMTGYERAAAWGVGLTTLVNVALNAILIPKWGMGGAAVASAISVMGWNLSFAFLVRQKLGIYSSDLAKLILLRMR